VADANCLAAIDKRRAVFAVAQEPQKDIIQLIAYGEGVDMVFMDIQKHSTYYWDMILRDDGSIPDAAFNGSGSLEHGLRAHD
jgi:hypothetical protein